MTLFSRRRGLDVTTEATRTFDQERSNGCRLLPILRSPRKCRLQESPVMRNPARLLITTAIVVAAALATTARTAAQATAAAPTYLDPIDLGTLGGNETRAYAANGARIVGASQTIDGLVHAFKYENGALIDLGTLGGSTSWAFAVNAAGAVTGSASLANDVAAHAFLWTEESGMLDLGTLGGTYSRASGINDAGQVSGWSQVAGDVSYHAFLWDPTTGMGDLGTLGGDTSFAYDVGAVVCGEAATVDGARHAFITSADALTDLGTLGGTYSAAINCRDPSGRFIVGESSVSDDSVTHAVSWNSEFAITDLGTLGGTESRALRVLSDEVLGESRTGDGDLHPVRWWHGRLADFAHVLGADSQIELVVPLAVPVTGDLTKQVVSGAAYPGADVHAYIVVVPRFNDPSAPRTINDGVIENIEQSQDVTRFAFTTEDVTAALGSRTYFRRCRPCAAGSTVSLSQNQLVTEDSSGSATVRGNQYDSIAMPQVRYTITAESVTIPTTGEQLITLSRPFTYSGFVLGASVVPGWLYDYLFGVSLRGAGTATFQIFSCDECILPDGRRIYSETELKYAFEPQ
jgi:probable HAF family extracellular repeat protein